MTPEELRLIFNNPNDKYNVDLMAIRFAIVELNKQIQSLSERVETFEKKGKKK